MTHDEIQAKRTAIRASVLLALKQQGTPAKYRAVGWSDYVSDLIFADKTKVCLRIEGSQRQRWSVTVGDYGDDGRKRFGEAKGTFPFAAIACKIREVAEAKRVFAAGEDAAKVINARVGVSDHAEVCAVGAPDGTLRLIADTTGTPEQIEAVLRAAVACGLVRL